MNINYYVCPGLKREFVPSYKILRRLRISVEEIIDIVASYCGVKAEDITSNKRNGDIVNARHIVCGVMRNEFDYSLKSIGNSLGERHHTTIIHSLRTFQDRMDVEEGYKELVDKITKAVQSKIDSNYLKVSV